MPTQLAPNEGQIWTYAIDEAALKEGVMMAVYPLGVNVVVARVDGAIYAVSGACAHMACPMASGRLDGYTLSCPCHDWRYDIRNGRMLDAPELGLAVYPIKTYGGKLYISLG
ncbi:MAG: Rieske (2Fe-2S) protein [Spirochaetaceae bacterium]|nr:Rieske (2Fe-2S) protein [Spirochaetaceae bacterium]